MKIREIECKSAIGKCGFPSGGWAVNPYVGCAHGCVYCYARFMKRFTGHTESWGSFVDVRVNLAEVIAKQMQSQKYKTGQIFIGTVTDPYQPIEEKYQLTRQVLGVLLNHNNPVSILTKSDLVLRDIDLLKKFQDVDVGFTIATLNEKWKNLTEPNSPSVKKRLQAMEKLRSEGISVFAMMGPYYPIFTDPEALFKEFKRVGVSQVFTESLNTIGGNWTGVEEILKKHYPETLPTMQGIFFDTPSRQALMFGIKDSERSKERLCQDQGKLWGVNPPKPWRRSNFKKASSAASQRGIPKKVDKRNFFEFYSEAENKVKRLSEKYQIPATIYFGLRHAA